MKNEEIMIEQCLRALALYTDAIIVLDDASEDRSVNIVTSLIDECTIEKIICKDNWFRDEPGDRNLLLQAGREIGGTHFIVIDADEIFTANQLENNYLRNKILQLEPGDQIWTHWIRLWRSIDQFRIDGAEYKNCIFCDDGQCTYESGYIHTPRIPRNLTPGTINAEENYEKYGLLHFQAVNWNNIRIRKAWYQCMERIRQPHMKKERINTYYNNMINEDELSLMPSPSDWYSGYDFFNKEIPGKNETWKEKQILQWFERYGRSHFADLNIWDIDWDS